MFLRLLGNLGMHMLEMQTLKTNECPTVGFAALKALLRTSAISVAGICQDHQMQDCTIQAYLSAQCEEIASMQSTRDFRRGHLASSCCCL